MIEKSEQKEENVAVIAMMADVEAEMSIAGKRKNQNSWKNTQHPNHTTSSTFDEMNQGDDCLMEIRKKAVKEGKKRNTEALL